MPLATGAFFCKLVESTWLKLLLPIPGTKQAIWQVLDAKSIWIKEFTSALASFVPTLGWSPVIGWKAFFNRGTDVEQLDDPPMRLCHFPLERSYHRFPVSLIARLGARQSQRMLSVSANHPAENPLICTTPYYAVVAERWPGPVIYYQTDLTYGYATVDPNAVLSLDRRMCKVATAVCPNSRRVGEYLVKMAGCHPEKITVIPNATRQINVLPEPPATPVPLPADLAHLPRPVAGVVGNLAANLDWSLIDKAIAQTPQISWAFIGPTSMEIPDAAERSIRARLMSGSGRLAFVGAKPYKELAAYAQSFDVAILPYRRKEPTYSGSSTRFYEHVAACRPMIATRGFEELLRKEPLLHLAETADELVSKLGHLASMNFDDGHTVARWEASKHGTWENRALGVIEAVKKRWPGQITLPPLPPAQHQPEDIFSTRADEPFQLMNMR